jgi:class 3 adenylate cyclase
MAGISARYIDGKSVQCVIDLLSSDGGFPKMMGLHMVQRIGKKRGDFPIEVITGKLYSLLENHDRNIRVESLSALISLEDDYAEKIVQEWLASDDEELIGEVLLRLKERLTLNFLPQLSRLFTFEGDIVQNALRELLPALSYNSRSHRVRDALLNALKQSTGTDAQERGLRKQELRIGRGEAFLHPKLEYKTRQEHSQILTVFFIDMAGYTERSSRSDMSNLMKIIRNFEENVVPSVERFRGHVVKKLGDGILAVFKHPVSATVAALEIQQKICEYNRYSVEEEKFQVRIGLDTGTVVWKDNDIFGDVVNTASRMETSAEPGEILITENVRAQISDFVTCENRGDLTVKGKEGALPVYVPLDVSRAVRALLHIKKANAQAVAEDGSGAAVERLKEAFYVPRFRIPPGISETLRDPVHLVNLLHTLFSDLSEAASEISHDYHEEYLFKRYLQEKWDATITSLRKLI